MEFLAPYIAHLHLLSIASWFVMPDVDTNEHLLAALMGSNGISLRDMRDRFTPILRLELYPGRTASHVYFRNGNAPGWWVALLQ